MTATLSGTTAAVSERIGLATAATNPNTRHPLLTATTTAQLEDVVGILRRLWRGEAVAGQSGPDRMKISPASGRRDRIVIESPDGAVRKGFRAL